MVLSSLIVHLRLLVCWGWDYCWDNFCPTTSDGEHHGSYENKLKLQILQKTIETVYLKFGNFSTSDDQRTYFMFGLFGFLPAVRLMHAKLWVSLYLLNQIISQIYLKIVLYILILVGKISTQLLWHMVTKLLSAWSHTNDMVHISNSSSRQWIVVLWSEVHVLRQTLRWVWIFCPWWWFGIFWHFLIVVSEFRTNEEILKNNKLHIMCSILYRTANIFWFTCLYNRIK